MASPLKVAIIGTGLIAQVKHIPAWQKMKGKANLEVAVNVDEKQGKEVCEKFGIARLYKSLDEMLEKEKPDVVDICTPPRFHCANAVAAINAGAHTMIEKPMAMNIDECNQIIAARDAKNVKVMCCHSDLFYIAYQKAREMVEKGEIGGFRGMRIFLSTPVEYITAKKDHWGNKLPGGVIGETGPHLVYMTLPFIPIVDEVSVVARKLLNEYPWSPFEDYRIELAGKEGICSITAAYTCTEWLCQVEFIGTDAILRIDLETQSVVKYTRKFTGERVSAKVAALSQVSEAMQLVGNTLKVGTKYATGSVPSSHDLMAQQFTDCILNNSRSPVPAEEGRETVRILDEIVAQLDRKYGPKA
jgi:predicted dehydrogenase